MAAQDRHQGDDERLTGGVALADGDSEAASDEEIDARVAELQAALDRKERQLAAVVEQYEQLLQTKERLRNTAGPDDGAFVWTDGSDRSETALDRLR